MNGNDAGMDGGPVILAGPWRETPEQRLVRLASQARNVEAILCVRNGRLVRVPLKGQAETAERNGAA